MHSVFENSTIQHLERRPKLDGAALTELPPSSFDTAEQEITSWEGYAPTPLIGLPNLAEQIGVGQLSYKDEGHRFGLQSFKASGGAYAILRLLQRELSQRLGGEVKTTDILAGKYNELTSEFTFAASTDGNHGRSVAWGAARCGAKSRIYIGTSVSEGRAEAMRRLGAEIVRTEGGYAESAARVRAEVKENGWHAVVDTASKGYEEIPNDILAGYGLMAREITRQMTVPPSHVFLQASVGGMASAVASVLVQKWGANAPRIVVVETEHAANLFLSAQTGEPSEVEIEVETIMGGLSCGECSTTAWNILSEATRDFVTMPDVPVIPTVQLLAFGALGDPVIEAGETGVAGLCAALCCASQEDLRSKLGLNQRSHVLVIGTEGATDPEIYKMIISGGPSGRKSG